MAIFSYCSCLSVVRRALLVLAFGLGGVSASCAQPRQVSAYQAAVTLTPRLAALDSANGFRGYIFGARVSDWPTPLPTLRTTRHGQLMANLGDQQVVIGDLILRGVQLSFYNGRLARIVFAPTSEAYVIELLRVMQALYGQGQPAGSGRVAWRGQRVTLFYERVVLNKGISRRVESTYQGQVSLFSNVLWAEAEVEQLGSRHTVAR